MLYNIVYYCQCAACFKQFFHPSSGAKNCTHRIVYLLNLFAAAASMGVFQITHASGSSKQA
jgi:hypothetical protein